MFLVSNTKMMIAALENGISAAFPALNYRTEDELRSAIQQIKSKTDVGFGINLIVNKSNSKLDFQLKVCVEEKVQYVITSLGNPKDVINQCKQAGVKVLCDVVDLEYAKKVEALGADGIIAVNSQAGGHCGPLSVQELIPLLVKECSIPVISAGGVATKKDVDQALELGAAGVSVGTVFIATEESDVSDDYKNAIVQYGAKDIVLTKKLSGSPSTVINTPFVKEMGAKENLVEVLIRKFPRFKKYLKMIVMYRGMKSVEKAAFGSTYKTIWCAGPVIEHVKEIKSVQRVVRDLTE